MSRAEIRSVGTMLLGAVVVMAFGAVLCGGTCWLRLTLAGVPEEAIIGDVQIYASLGAGVCGGIAMLAAAIR